MRLLLKYSEGVGRLHVPEADYFPANGTAVFAGVSYSFQQSEKGGEKQWTLKQKF